MRLERFLEVTRALNDATRMRALMAVRGQELCLCQLVGLLDLAPSTLSQHMRILHAAGLVERRRQGRWQYFRAAGEGAPPEIRRAVEAALDALADDPRIARDRRRLRALCRVDPEQLTACYRIGQPASSGASN